MKIPVLSWFDEPILHSIKSVFDGLNIKTESLDLLKKYRNAHFKSTRAMVGTIKILGMAEPVNLQHVYSPARVSTTIHRRLYREETYKAPTNAVQTHAAVTQVSEGNLVRGDQFVESHNRIAVLGGPGSGKTTFLKHLAMAYVDKAVFQTTDLKTSKFPVFVPMPVYANAEKSLEEFVASDLIRRTDGYAPHFVRRLLSSGMCVFLLDSLDEVPPKQRPRVINALNDFCIMYPDNKLVLSCRTADYQEWLPGFFEVELARLSKTAGNKIIKAWFSDDEKKAEKLIRHLKADPGVASLTGTPLLLSLLCIQFRHDLTLPQRKTELYRRCVDTLLRDWDAGRGFRRDTAYSKMSDDRKERLFETVAGSFFTDQPAYVFETTGVVELIGDLLELFDIDRGDAAGILEEIEQHHGILEKSSVESHCFSHPSFQEYFAARHFLGNHSDMECVKKCVEKDAWAPVIEFMVALKKDPSDILLFLQSKSTFTSLQTYPAMARRTRNLWLLYRCLSLGPAIPATLWAQLTAHLVESQIEMSRVYREGGVVPLASLVHDGVQHVYYSYGKRRPTLFTALQPFRRLANELLVSPSPRYADAVLDMLKKLDLSGRAREDNVAVALCLIIPLATTRPHEVDQWLDKLTAITQFGFMKPIIAQSQKILKERFFSQKTH